MELTHKDRVMLSLLLQVLEKVEPDGAAHLEKYRTAIECGYELHYDDFEHIYEDTLSGDKCKEVQSILLMFRVLKVSYEALAPDEQSTIELRRISFFGFDGNCETKQFAYADYVINTLGQYEEQADTDLNSHMPSLDIYRRMLVEYEQATKKYELSAEEIRRVADAKTHPEHRPSQVPV